MTAERDVNPEQRLLRQVLISIGPTLLVGIANRAVTELNWVLLLGVFAGVLLLQRLYPELKTWWQTLDCGRRKGVYLVSLGSLLLVLLAGWYHVVGPRLSQCLVADEDVVALVRRHRWITYDPPGYNPVVGRNPTTSSMQIELQQVRQAGFTGIITFTSREPLDTIPSLAKECGLAVIMGIYDPADRMELLLAAHERDCVDGYVVGHNRLGTGYSYPRLLAAMRWLRLRTRRPVTTTERMENYLYNPQLVRIGDWVFPDVHLSLRDTTDRTPFTIFRADARRDVAELVEHARQMADMARKHGKPLLLKMVTYPVGGISYASPEEQARFFELLLQSRADVESDLPLDVSLAVHSAFDVAWKRTWPFYPWEPYTGVLDSNGAPRPAVKFVVERLP